MVFQLKVFKSLNCSQCSVPFSKDVNDRNSPRKFPACGLTVCKQCFEGTKSMMRRRTRRPPNQNHDCYANDLLSCLFYAVKPAYFLIELLNSLAIVESPDRNGYYLTKQFDIPECVICQEEYSLETEDRKPCDLTCNHTICFGCVKKTRRHEDQYSPRNRYSTICPCCFTTGYALDRSASCGTNSLIEFLKELPKLTQQLETIEEQKRRQQPLSRNLSQVHTGDTTTTFSPTIEIPDRFDCPKSVNTEKTATTFSPTIEITNHFNCSECVRKFPIEDMFSCSDCSKKICGICGCRQHREHKLIELLVEETQRISQEMKEIISIQIDGYRKIFPELHQQLVEKIAAFEKILGEKVEGISKLENLEKTKGNFDECKKFRNYGDRFERISEDYLPNLRSFDTNLQILIDELKEAKISEKKMETEKK